MAHMIFHLDLDVFFVAVERLLDPSLEGKAVIVSPGTARSVVATASYEARRFGVYSAQPLALARRLCPQAVICPGHFKDYQHYSRAFFQILRNYSPLLEPASLDEAYLDYTGCEQLFGAPLAGAAAIQKQVKEKLGLDVSVGVATSKVTAKIASDLAKPAGLLMVCPGQETAFLSPLPIRRLPGVGPKSEPRMKTLGLHRIGDLMKVPPAFLSRAFGSQGPWLQQLAQGQDDSPVRPRAAAKSIGHEETFLEDVTDPEKLRHALQRLTCEVGYRLRKHGFKARTISVKIRYADFSLHGHAKTLDSATNVDRLLFETAQELLAQLWARRVRIRLLGITARNLEHAPDQLQLFSSCRHAAWERLHAAADQVKRRYGYDSLRPASLLRQDAEG